MSDDRFGGARYQPPEAMRTAFEQGLTQAKTLFDEMMAATERAMGAFEGSAKVMQSHAIDANRKIVGMTEANMTASLAFAERLVRARDVQDVLAAHQDFVRSQMQRFTEETRELTELARAASTKMTENAKDASSDLGG